MMIAFPGLGFDPAPGDPVVVAELEAMANSVAIQFQQALDAVQSVGQSGSLWEGLAARAFHQRLGHLPQYMQDGEQSMYAAARALGRWEADLIGMKRTADSYEQDARSAMVAVVGAREQLEELEAQSAPHDPMAQHNLHRALADAAARLRQAQAQLEAVIDAARRLLTTHGGEAQEIARLINAAASYAPVAPGLWKRIEDAIVQTTEFLEALPGKVWHWVQEHADLIGEFGELLSQLSGILGLLALAFPALAPLALGMAVAGAGLELVAKLAGDKDISWFDVGVAAVGALSGGAGLAARSLKEGAEATGEMGAMMQSDGNLFRYVGAVTGDGEAFDLGTLFVAKGGEMIEGAENTVRGAGIVESVDDMHTVVDVANDAYNVAQDPAGEARKLRDVAPVVITAVSPGALGVTLGTDFLSALAHSQYAAAS